MLNKYIYMILEYQESARKPRYFLSLFRKRKGEG
jgi:hypothetical protein